MTLDSDTMLNHQLSQKFKLIEISKFNHLIITLTKYVGTIFHIATQ
jgi:DNA repair protein RadC